MNLTYKIDYLNKNINLLFLKIDNKEISFNLINGINYYLYYNKKEDSINKTKIYTGDNNLIASIISVENIFEIKEFKNENI